MTKPEAVQTARFKVIKWMTEQEAKGLYPYAWRAPAWNEYTAELDRFYRADAEIVGDQNG